MECHKQAVGRIASAVRAFYLRGEGFRISHGSTNSTRPSTHSKPRVVDASALRHILKVDRTAKTALVEPNVPMDRLVDTTLKYGLVPAVVMEFPGITAGGGYNGTSGESSSFKHGFFNETLNAVEMVLANGDVVRASETERSDLFHGAAGAVGTLGVTTLVELRLQEAASHVETTYHPVSSVAEAADMIRQFIQDPTLDYVDGILFSPSAGAVITGRLTSQPSPTLPVQTFTNAWDPWFYLHVKSRISQSDSRKASMSRPITEAIPLWDYLFRYDRGGFWVGRSAFHYFHFPFNRFTRWFLDDFTRTRMMYAALHASGESKRYIVQDLAMPFESAEEFVQYTDKRFSIWPLWLCPLRQKRTNTMHPHAEVFDTRHDGKPLAPLLNIGLWGEGPRNLGLDDWVSLNRELENKLHELGGMKWLYAHTYYTEDEFWRDFDKEWYEGLRDKYGARNLPNVWEKVRVDVQAERKSITSWVGKLRSIRPIGGIWGIWEAIRSKEYLKSRRKTWDDIELKG